MINAVADLLLHLLLISREMTPSFRREQVCGLLQRTRLRETLARLQAERNFLPRTRRGKK